MSNLTDDESFCFICDTNLPILLTLALLNKYKDEFVYKTKVIESK